MLQFKLLFYVLVGDHRDLPGLEVRADGQTGPSREARRSFFLESFCRSNFFVAYRDITISANSMKFHSVLYAIGLEPPLFIGD